ncbi:hypothetical protein QBC98_007007 [Kitasatospora acidiphila]
MARYDLIMAVAAGNRRHYALEADKFKAAKAMCTAPCTRRPESRSPSKS